MKCLQENEELDRFLIKSNQNSAVSAVELLFLIDSKRYCFCLSTLYDCESVIFFNETKIIGATNQSLI